MTLAIIWLIWQTISSVVNAAWSGEAISREWHSVWGPLRIVFGLGLLAPVANGNNAAQLLVIQVSSWSGQVANSIYRTSLSVMNNHQTNAQNVLSDAEISQFIKAMAVIDLCNRSVIDFEVMEGQLSTHMAARGRNTRAAAARRERQSGGVGWHSALQSSTSVVSAKQDSEGVTFSASAACPGLEIQYKDNPRWLSSRLLSTLSFGRAGAGQDDADMRRRIRETWVNALNEIESSFRPIGAGLIQMTFGALVAQNAERSADDFIRQLRDWETASIERWRQATKQAVDIVREVRGASRIEGLDRLGWLNAPAIIVRQTTMMRDAWGVANTRPSVMRLNEFASALQDEVGNRRFRRYASAVAVVGDELNSPFSAREREAIEAAASGGEQRAMPDRTRTAAAWGMIPDVDIRRGSPLMQVADWGFWLMETGSIIWGTAATAKIAANIVNRVNSAVQTIGIPSIGIDILGRGVAAIAAFGMLLGGVMILVGMLHAYILPLMPTIIFIIFALGCLILVIEALIAAPLWALGHIKLAGQGVVDQTQLPGYQILLNLFIRIPIAMMAFVFSLLVVDTVLFGVSQLIGEGFGAHTSNIGPIGYIAFMLVYGFISWTICLRAFSMINDLPDKVLRWIQIQSAANQDDGQRYVVGGLVMGMQRAGAATSAAGAALTSPVRAAAGRLPAPGPASKLRPPGGLKA
jgi:conjugal transfer/type IV secretion protein DotA/TraY